MGGNSSHVKNSHSYLVILIRSTSTSYVFAAAGRVVEDLLFFYKGFARGRLGAARYACGRRNRHSVGKEAQMAQLAT